LTYQVKIRFQKLLSNSTCAATPRREVHLFNKEESKATKVGGLVKL
jgi:hypothetical protein